MHSGDINNCGNFIRQFFLDFRRINEPDGVAEFCADLLVVSSVKNHHGLNSNAVNISGCIKAPFRPRCFGVVWRSSRYLVSSKLNQNSRKNIPHLESYPKTTHQYQIHHYQRGPTERDSHHLNSRITLR